MLSSLPYKWVSVSWVLFKPKLFGTICLDLKSDGGSLEALYTLSGGVGKGEILARVGESYFPIRSYNMFTRKTHFKAIESNIP